MFFTGLYDFCRLCKAVSRDDYDRLEHAIELAIGRCIKENMLRS